LIVFPNPSSGTINLPLNSSVERKFVNVYDVYGKLVKQMKLATNEGILNLRGLADGAYTIQISGEHTGVQTTKVILQR